MSYGTSSYVFSGEVDTSVFYKPKTKFAIRHWKGRKKPTKGAFGGQAK
jgi:hypothetical protein